LVLKTVELMRRDDYNVGGQLGGRNSARRRAYERLKDYIERLRREAPLFLTQDLNTLWMICTATRCARLPVTASTAR